MNTKIISWLLGAIASWGSPSNPPEHRAHLAESFAAVAYDADEPPLYQGPTGRALTAINLVSVASLESRFEERIILGHCKPHECDHGMATGLMQVHLGPHGLRLVGNKDEQCLRFADDCLLPAQLWGDEVAQIRAGLHVLRTQGFRAFSPHLAARAQAAAFVARHPVPVGDGEVMGEAEARR